MKRNSRAKKPDMIITSDLHLRDSTPKCRTDDYFAAQARKIAFLKEVQHKYMIPILDAGDTFDKWKSSPFIERWAIENLPTFIDGSEAIITIPGNHEMPGRNINFLDKSSLLVIEAARIVNVLKVAGLPFMLRAFAIYGYPYGSEIIPITKENKFVCKKRIAIIHDMIYHKEKLPPGVLGTKATSLLRKLKQFDLIITGHNHKPFTTEHNGRLLINPGSMMRAKADQVEHRPRFYLWYADTNTCEAVFYPIEKDVISRKHIDIIKRKDKRTAAFVARVNDVYEVGFSFEKNMESYFKANKESKRVKNICWEVME